MTVKAIKDAAWAAYCAAPTCRDMGRSKVDAAVDVALTETGGSDGWQPIDSAPKDGTEVDLWVSRDGKGGFRVINFCFCRGQWRRHGDETLLQIYGWDDMYPTHWRPLPETPK